MHCTHILIKTWCISVKFSVNYRYNLPNSTTDYIELHTCSIKHNKVTTSKQNFY